VDWEREKTVGTQFQDEEDQRGIQPPCHLHGMRMQTMFGFSFQRPLNDSNDTKECKGCKNTNDVQR